MFTSIVFLGWCLFEKLESCSERGDVLRVGVCLQIVYEFGQMSFVRRSQCDQLLGVAAGVARGGWGVWCLDDFIGHNNVHLKGNVYNIRPSCYSSSANWLMKMFAKRAWQLSESLMGKRLPRRISMF